MCRLSIRLDIADVVVDGDEDTARLTITDVVLTVLFLLGAPLPIITKLVGSMMIEYCMEYCGVCSVFFISIGEMNKGCCLFVRSVCGMMGMMVMMAMASSCQPNRNSSQNKQENSEDLLTNCNNRKLASYLCVLERDRRSLARKNLQRTTAVLRHLPGSVCRVPRDYC